MPMAVAYRSLCVLMLLFATLMANIAAPAWACGCGAYIPDHPGATVVDERALIAWDGSTEDILMSFGVRGASERAAWVMPVPSAARVTLGDAGVFTELARITAPRTEYRDSWWPTFDWLTGGSRGALESAGARPGSVSVLGNQRIGPSNPARYETENGPMLLSCTICDVSSTRRADADRITAPPASLGAPAVNPLPRVYDSARAATTVITAVA